MLFNTLNKAHSDISIIRLGGNEKIDDKCIRSICEFIKSNITIQDVNVRDTQISDIGIKELSSILCQDLREDTKLRSLNFHGNKKITNKSIPLLIQLIETTHIEHIGVEYTSINQRNALLVPLTNNKLENGKTNLDLSSK